MFSITTVSSPITQAMSSLLLQLITFNIEQYLDDDAVQLNHRHLCFHSLAVFTFLVRIFSWSFYLLSGKIEFYCQIDNFFALVIVAFQIKELCLFLAFPFSLLIMAFSNYLLLLPKNVFIFRTLAQLQLTDAIEQQGPVGGNIHKLLSFSQFLTVPFSELKRKIALIRAVRKGTISINFAPFPLMSLPESSRIRLYLTWKWAEILLNLIFISLIAFFIPLFTFYFFSPTSIWSVSLKCSCNY